MTESSKKPSSPAAKLPRDGVYVVIPAYNEGPALADVLIELRTAYPNVVVVDDGSSDDTVKVAKKHAAYVLRHLVNRGQGAALQTGIDFALERGAEYVVTFDADGQHRVEDIARLIAPIVAGQCEITLGSRFLGEEAVGMPRSRRLMLRAAVIFTRWANRVEVTDAHNGLRAFSRKAAEHIQITLDRMAHASEILDFIRYSGLPFREIPVQIRYTEYSLAKGQSARGALQIVFQYLIGKVLR